MSQTRAQPTQALTLTTAQCAAMAQVKPKTILAWLAEGKFPDPIINLPTCKRWNRHDVERFFKTGKVR